MDIDGGDCLWGSAEAALGYGVRDAPPPAFVLEDLGRALAASSPFSQWGLTEGQLLGGRGGPPTCRSMDAEREPRTSESRDLWTHDLFVWVPLAPLLPSSVRRCSCYRSPPTSP